ncbi:alpha/beta hydrolase [Marinilactibacillus sp. XAAS-LB27]|uniref:alpha/beta fold hydrolase n=1 Tax=Marinilactibacillus sp. XAAS-LB27 TaxID=3114538 RepID=UPI002E18FAE6|nr:alpha/beta hydrolase [Marinilactibacillus sp. XAAS-LB27]
MNEIEHAYIQTNGIQLHVAQQGPDDGELVLLLHGFPEFWYGWRKQMAELAEQGYRVWAPDQRGYNLSDKPENVKDYDMKELVEDIAGLIRQSGRDQVILAGHDWGGIVSWKVAETYPELIKKMMILNAPHLAAMSKHVLEHPSQLLKSSYILFFQLRGIPEKLVSRANWGVATSALIGSSLKGTFSSRDLQEYRLAWSQPNAMTTMINWYRANGKNMMNASATSNITVPTYIIWGMNDQFLGKELASKSLDYCEDGKGILVGDTTHWLHHEKARQISQIMIDYIKED